MNQLACPLLIMFVVEREATVALRIWSDGGSRQCNKNERKKLKIMKMLKITGYAAMVGLSGMVVANAYTLTDLNSSATYDPDTSAGMSAWTVDGQDQLAKQWFWYRVGTTGAESAINTIAHTTTQIDSRRIETVFTSAGNFQITIGYNLLGGTAGSGYSDINESIRIINLKTTGALDFHFFQYSDFDMQGTANNDSAKLVSTGRIQQWDSTTGYTMSETVASIQPNRYEINTAAALLGKLSNNSADNLSNTPGPGVTLPATNVAWGFQWDFNIGAGSSVTFSKDKTISYAPVPDAGATLALLGAALTGLALFGRRLGRR